MLDENVSVIHAFPQIDGVASPFPSSTPVDEKKIIKSTKSLHGNHNSYYTGRKRRPRKADEWPWAKQQQCVVYRYDNRPTTNKIDPMNLFTYRTIVGNMAKSIRFLNEWLLNGQAHHRSFDCKRLHVCVCVCEPISEWANCILVRRKCNDFRIQFELLFADSGSTGTTMADCVKSESAPMLAKHGCRVEIQETKKKNGSGN